MRATALRAEPPPLEAGTDALPPIWQPGRTSTTTPSTSSLDMPDYMHARFYRPESGRFLSFDPAWSIGSHVLRPQQWNRYSYVGNNPLRFVDPTGTILTSVTGQDTILQIAADAAERLSFSADGTLDVSRLTPEDLVGNEGALLLYEMATSEHVYTYEEGPTMQTRGGVQKIDGVLNLDTHREQFAGFPKSANGRGYPPTCVDGAVGVDPSETWVDSATGVLVVPTRAIAFHEFAESHAKIEMKIPRGPHEGPGAHAVARDRELMLLNQRPTWTPFPAAGVLKRR